MNVHSDGRVARREKNREAVLDAVVELFADGGVNPAVEEVSARSGVSTRSVYRYFHHRDDLLLAAMRHLDQRIRETIRLDDIGVGPLDERIDRFVRYRVERYLRLAPLMRAVRASQTGTLAIATGDVDGNGDADGAGRPGGTDASAEAATDERVRLRNELAAHFATEFDELAGRERTNALTIVDLGFQFEAFDYLYGASGGDAAELAAMLRHLLLLHFDALAS